MEAGKGGEMGAGGGPVLSPFRRKLHLTIFIFLLNLEISAPCWSLGRSRSNSMWKPLTTEGSLPFQPGNMSALLRHSYLE